VSIEDRELAKDSRTVKNYLNSRQVEAAQLKVRTLETRMEKVVSRAGLEPATRWLKRRLNRFHPVTPW